MKKYLYGFMLMASVAITACSSSQDNTNESEDQQVNDMLKTDQERADSVKRALGIE